MDEHLIERVANIEAMHLDLAIANIRAQAKLPELLAIGVCHSCGEPLDHHSHDFKVKRFCDALCESEWEEWFSAMKRRYGATFKPQSAFNFVHPKEH